MISFLSMLYLIIDCEKEKFIFIKTDLYYWGLGDYMEQNFLLKNM